MNAEKTPFSDREDHLRQRAERGWVEDEDVRICIEEIDRLRADRKATGTGIDLTKMVYEGMD